MKAEEETGAAGELVGDPVNEAAAPQVMPARELVAMVQGEHPQNAVLNAEL